MRKKDKHQGMSLTALAERAFRDAPYFRNASDTYRSGVCSVYLRDNSPGKHLLDAMSRLATAFEEMGGDKLGRTLYIGISPEWGHAGMYQLRLGLKRPGNFYKEITTSKVNELMASEEKKRKIRLALEAMNEHGLVSDDYWPTIVNEILDDVVRNVDETAHPYLWNEDDVRLAVGRVLCERLGIEA